MYKKVQLGENVPPVNLNMFSSKEDILGRHESHGSLLSKEDLQYYAPEALNWSFKSHHQVETDTSAWEQVCTTVGEQCPKLARVNFTIPSNENSIPITKIFLENAYTEHVKTFTLADNCGNYTETLQTMTTNLPNLEILSLRNAGNLQHVTTHFCRALAALIRSLPNLRQVHLLKLSFPSNDEWMLVKQALCERPMLEDVRFHDLKVMVGPVACDISERASSDANFQAIRACSRYLVDEMKVAPSQITVHQRLQAHLRLQYKGTGGKMDGSDTADTVKALTTVVERVDFAYELLRNEVDPATWAHPSSSDSEPVVAHSPPIMTGKDYLNANASVKQSMFVRPRLRKRVSRQAKAA